MIIEGLLLIVKVIVLGFISLFPVIAIPANLLGAVAGVTELLFEASIFLPISTILICIGWFITLYNFRFVVSLANWVISKIPTIE